MTIAKYRSSIQSAVRGLWSDVLDKDQFVNAMDSAINRNIVVAWRTGAGECGIKPDEYTPEEKVALAKFIIDQQKYVVGFADAVQDGSKANGGKLTTFFSRAELWANRWEEAKTQAAAMACGDKKKEWELGPTEQHCKSCGGFAGKVYRYSVWLKNEALPQNRNLACKGYKCKCRLKDTSKPITRGKFPSKLLSEVNYAITFR